MSRLGAHVSISGGYIQALEKIVRMGGTCLQIFSSSPRGWNFTTLDSVEIEAFRERKRSLNVDPIYFHASYLINLADSAKTGHLSKLSLISELDAAAKLNIKGSIIHLGSFKKEPTEAKMTNLITHIKEILSQTPEESLFIIENAGNHKIGQSLEEIALIMERVNSKRVRICLDTCHLYSAGYDITDAGTLELFLDRFQSLIGIKYLELFHANDSRDPFHAGHDRHENIGEGSMGLTPFQLLLSHPKTKSLPFIIETPGFDNRGPDKHNLDVLKRLVKQSNTHEDNILESPQSTRKGLPSP